MSLCCPPRRAVHPAGMSIHSCAAGSPPDPLRASLRAGAAGCGGGPPDRPGAPVRRHGEPSGSRAGCVSSPSVHMSARWTGAHPLRERSRGGHVRPSVGAAAGRARCPSPCVQTKGDAVATPPLHPPRWSPQTPTPPAAPRPPSSPAGALRPPPSLPSWTLQTPTQPSSQLWPASALSEPELFSVSAGSAMPEANRQISCVLR